MVVGLVRRMERADVVRAPVEMPPGRNSIVLSGFLDDLYGVDGKNLYIRTRRLCDGGGKLTMSENAMLDIGSYSTIEFKP